MHRYQILIEYVGTNFIGWQIQSEGQSVQKLIQTKISKLLKEKIAKKDFKGFFELIARYPFLPDLDEYKKTIEFGEKLKKAAKTELKHANYNKVLQYTEMLENFPMFEEEAKRLKYEATILANFMQLIANKEYDKVYEFVKKEFSWEEIAKKFKDIIKTDLVERNIE